MLFLSGLCKEITLFSEVEKKVNPLLKEFSGYIVDYYEEQANTSSLSTILEDIIKGKMAISRINGNLSKDRHLSNDLPLLKYGNETLKQIIQIQNQREAIIRKYNDMVVEYDHYIRLADLPTGPAVKRDAAEADRQRMTVRHVGRVARHSLSLKKLDEQEELKKKELIDLEKTHIPSIDIINRDDYLKFLISSYNEALEKRFGISTYKKTFGNITVCITEFQKLIGYQTKALPSLPINLEHINNIIDKILTEPTY